MTMDEASWIYWQDQRPRPGHSLRAALQRLLTAILNTTANTRDTHSIVHHREEKEENSVFTFYFMLFTFQFH